MGGENVPGAMRLGLTVSGLWRASWRQDAGLAQPGGKWAKGREAGGQSPLGADPVGSCGDSWSDSGTGHMRAWDQGGQPDPGQEQDLGDPCP